MSAGGSLADLSVIKSEIQDSFFWINRIIYSL